MTLKNLSDLFENQIQDLYSAESQLVKAIPKLSASSHCNRLKAAFNSHLEQTKNHVLRLERIALELNFKLGGKTCSAMKGLIEEGGEAIDQSAPLAIHDANLIASAQRVEHYEISGYGTAREFAECLGHTDAAQMLQTTLDEERAADHGLTMICRGLFEKAPMNETDTKNATDQVKSDENRDPLTGEHGSHAIGAGVGAVTGGVAAGALSGAAGGMVAGPLGVVLGAGVGAVVGGVAGGFAGKALAESVNPTIEHEYWRSQFRSRRYVFSNEPYEVYAPAYQYGWEAQAGHKGQLFSEVENDLEKGWKKVEGSTSLTWDRAKDAVHDGWNHVTRKSA